MRELKLLETGKKRTVRPPRLMSTMAKARTVGVPTHLASRERPSLQDEARAYPAGKEIAGKDPVYSFLDPGPLANVYTPLVGWRTPSAELRGQEAASGAVASS